MVPVLAPVQLVLTGSAALDLLRRPSNQIRGPKILWWPGIFIQPFGSIAYLRWGRRREVR
ncbi:MAG TPA: PLDc N-terminal domain-containing protein [Pseudonocardiaceae bacterium]|nr:PLDc N-terminal domain-containing protein [Pseudonocardiaceae bacterium]